MAKKIDGAKVKRRKEAMREVKHMQANADSTKDMKAIKKRPAGRTFDGVSRPSNDLYRENYDMIFGKKESDELDESYKQSLRNKEERIFGKKNCSICKKSLPLNMFYCDKNGRHNFCCTPCDKIRKIKYRAENKEKIALADHKYINSERGYVGEVINGVFQRGRRNVRRKIWVPEITKQEIYDELMLYIQDNGRVCEYCKESWTYQRALGVRGQKNTARKRAGVESNFSIDRLNSTETYKRENIVFCCVGCNNRKNQVRLSDVVNIIKVWIKRRIA